jgi:hypothetical protein
LNIDMGWYGYGAKLGTPVIRWFIQKHTLKSVDP